MKLNRPLTALICLAIAASAWIAVLSRDRIEVALAAASLVSVLCAAILLLRLPSTADRGEKRPGPTQKDASAEFRRGVFQLCAALKLGIRFCEEHLHSDPDRLIEELERMNAHIGSFVNGITRPVRFYQRARWPWRVTSRGRAYR